MKNQIYFNLASIQGREIDNVREALFSGKISGNQTFSKKCQVLLEELIGVRRALVKTSCTHALEMAAILLGIEPGDEVIVPAFTFVSTANAFVLRGAKPVFCDIRLDTLNLDESKLEELITPRTRAIVPVHYAGVGCEMDVILEIAGRHGLAVVEDNAHGLFGKYRGHWLGTFGCMATQSFHETKNITCGEGGALLINEEQFIERAEIIREKGTNRAKFFQGQIDKYSWVDVGSSYVLSDLLAAFLYGQLEKWRDIQAKRKLIWEKYDAGLADWAAANGVRRPIVPGHCEQSYHMYYLLLPNLETRTRFINFLSDNGILTVFHYLPLDKSYFAEKMKIGHWDTNKKYNCDITENISNRLVRLPFYNSLTDLDQQKVIYAIQKNRI